MSDILIDRPELASLGTYEFGWSDSDVADSAHLRLPARRSTSAAAAMPAASQPVTPWPVSGLASGLHAKMHPGGDAFPCRSRSGTFAQWPMSRLDSLTVAGAVPE